MILYPSPYEGEQEGVTNKHFTGPILPRNFVSLSPAKKY